MSPGPAHRLPAPTAEAPLLDWLFAALAPMSRTKVRELFQAGRVLVNETPVTRHDHVLKPGDRVAVAREARRLGGKDLEVAGIRVVAEDDHLVVIDKPAGLLTVATEGERVDTAFAWLNRHLRDRRAGRPFVVHRLDRDTSGLLLFARSEETKYRLQAAWGDVTKTYLAVTEGPPRPPEGVVENYLTEGKDLKVRASSVAHPDARRAVTRYKLTRIGKHRPVVEVGLETGRKHQIRVHLAGVGSPVIGDKLYGAKTDPARRLGLHAWRLAFPHPVGGERVEFESPLPAVLKQAAGVGAL